MFLQIWKLLKCVENNKNLIYIYKILEWIRYIQCSDIWLGLSWVSRKILGFLVFLGILCNSVWVRLGLLLDVFKNLGAIEVYSK